MSEGYKPANETKEPFIAKKEIVVAFISKKLAEAEAGHKSLSAQVDYYSNRNRRSETSDSSDTPTTIPAHVWADGGSDLSDWKVETGVDRYEDDQATAYLSPEVQRELGDMEQKIQELKQNLDEINSAFTEDNLDSDTARTFSLYLEQASAPTA